MKIDPLPFNPPGALRNNPPDPEFILALTLISSSAINFNKPCPFEKLILLEELYSIHVSVGGYPSALKFVFSASSSNFTTWVDCASPP